MNNIENLYFLAKDQYITYIYSARISLLRLATGRSHALFTHAADELKEAQ